MNYSSREIFDLLNEQDECTFIEAKTGSESSHSIMETACSFSNEPGLGGGYLLIGVAIDNSSIFPQYKVVLSINGHMCFPVEKKTTFV